MSRLGFVVMALSVLVASGGTLPASAGDDTQAQVLVVDDDLAQCPHAGFASVQQAVDAAQEGALVRVCPGVYPGLVTVDKPLTLLGRPNVAALDCFADELVVDPSRYPVLRRPAGQPGNLLTVAAPDVTVAGLVLEGATTVVPEGPSIYDAAVLLRPSSSPARVRHNLIRDNDLGIDVGSVAGTRTRVDHNCLRDNGWGLGSQRADFVDGLVDNNETFRQEVFSFEVGWSQRSNIGTTYEANLSRQDGTGTGSASFWVANSSSVTITGNRIVGGTGSGIQLLPSGGTMSTDVVLTGNEVSGVNVGIGIGTDAQARPAVDTALLESNTLSGNNIGVSLQRANRNVTVRSNVASDNAQVGIWSRPMAAGHLFEDNTMLGNGLADARDDNRTANTWVGSSCVTDVPVGTICGR
jgi:parallel beta-helix repeat protein